MATIQVFRIENVAKSVLRTLFEDFVGVARTGGVIGVKELNDLREGQKSPADWVDCLLIVVLVTGLYVTQRKAIEELREKLQEREEPAPTSAAAPTGTAAPAAPAPRRPPLGR